MNNRGFIATSVLYSFFLAFIAVIVAIISSSLSNRTILNKFNEDAMDRLNESEYSVSVYSRNATITNGTIFRNILSNSDFSEGSDGLDNWTIVGSNTTYNSFNPVLYETLITRYYDITESRIQQEVNLIQNHQYFYAINYRQDHYYELKTYLSNDSSIYIKTGKTDGNVQAYNRVKMSDASGNYNFVIGQHRISGESYQIRTLGTTYYNNALLIDLTDTYNTDKEIPTDEWLNDNISWFDGTISFIKKRYSSKTGEITLSLTPFNSNAYISKLKCSDGVDTVIEERTEASVITISQIGSTPCKIVANSDDKTLIKTLTIDNIKGNIRCDIDWT